ncbi:PTS fructose transporter subunit IIABC [Butyrivibrio sp. NC3005]|uniref:PTS fructose transporter subunit IIABC n=1 Tax=Butyrivibrio sp. NC3005 TaxID=1280685 RepID=UPI000417CA3C|nr:fructose-specific PTS transporter subunit EIIC [Butyrivibrio sp. NC3005]
MKISEFLNPQGIKLKMSLADQNSAIDELIALHESCGNLNNAAVFKDAILAREAKGSTAIGMGIAVPHGKSASVKKAGLAAITCPDGVDYKSLDGKPAKLLFMIAAPEGGADTHLEVLSKLMTMLMDANFTQKLIAANSVDEFMKIIDDKEAEKDKEKAGAQAQNSSSIKIVGVTACPTGIAHTFMAAEALEQAAKEKNITIKVETDGQGGAKNVLTASDISNADVVIVAVDRNVEMARFDGKKVIKASTKDAIHGAANLIDKAVKGDAPVYHHEGGSTESASFGDDETLGRKFYKHLMNGVTHMLPFVIGGGILVAIAFLIDTICGFGETGGGNFGSMTPASALLKYIGGLAMGLMVPVLAGFIGESIADRPGLAVGFAGGLLAANGNALFADYIERWGGEGSLSGFSEFISKFGFQGKGNTVSGFLGGIAAGFLAGAIIILLRKLCSGFPKSLEGIKSILIYPLCGIFLMGIVMCFVLNPFIGFVNTSLSTMLNSLYEANAIAVLGLVLGAMMAIDMGGPINKAAYVFGTGMLAQAALDPSVEQVAWISMAAIMVGGMVPPVGIALACKLFPKKFTNEEQETWITNIIMGASFITEGAIPFAAGDPIHIIPATLVGSGVAGLLSALFKCTLKAPHGGVFVFATVGNPLLYIIAWAIGSVITCVLIGMLRKDRQK